MSMSPEARILIDPVEAERFDVAVAHAEAIATAEVPPETPELTEAQRGDLAAAFAEEPLVPELPQPAGPGMINRLKNRAARIVEGVQNSPAILGRVMAGPERKADDSRVKRLMTSRTTIVLGSMVALTAAKYGLHGLHIGHEAIADAATTPSKPAVDPSVAHHAVAVSAPSEILNGKGQIVDPSNGHIVGPNIHNVTQTDAGQLDGVSNKQWKNMHEHGLTASMGKPVPAHEAVTTTDPSKEHVARAWHTQYEQNLDVQTDKKGNVHVTFTGGAHSPKDLDLAVTGKGGQRTLVDLDHNGNVYSQTFAADTDTAKLLGHGHEKWAEVVSTKAAHGKQPEHWNVFATESGDGSGKVAKAAEQVRQATEQQPTINVYDVRHHEIITAQGTTNFDLPKGTHLEVAKDGAAQSGNIQYHAGNVLVMDKKGNVLAAVDQNNLGALGDDGKLPSGVVKSINDQLSTQGVELKGKTVNGETTYALQDTPVDHHGLTHRKDDSSLNRPATPTATPSHSASATPSASASATPSHSPSATPSHSASATATPEGLKHRPDDSSLTRPATVAPSASTSETPTPSATVTHESSASPKITATPNHSHSATASATPEGLHHRPDDSSLNRPAEPSHSASASETPSHSPSASASETPTHTPTPTHSHSATATPSESATPAHTPATPSHSATPESVAVDLKSNAKHDGGTTWVQRIPEGAFAGTLAYTGVAAARNAYNRTSSTSDTPGGHWMAGMSEAARSRVWPIAGALGAVAAPLAMNSVTGAIAGVGVGAATAVSQSMWQNRGARKAFPGRKGRLDTFTEDERVMNNSFAPLGLDKDGQIVESGSRLPDAQIATRTRSILDLSPVVRKNVINQMNGSNLDVLQQMIERTETSLGKQEGGAETLDLIAIRRQAIADEEN